MYEGKAISETIYIELLVVKEIERCTNLCTADIQIHHLTFYRLVLKKLILILTILSKYSIIVNNINMGLVFMNEWQELTTFSESSSMVVERVRFNDRGITVEGRFELPPLARLSMDDQLFIIAFIQSHGSIKEMESVFGISYPTVKNRLNRIAGQLDFVQINPPSSRSEVLEQLDRDEITIDEAIEKLKGVEEKRNEK